VRGVWGNLLLLLLQLLQLHLNRLLLQELLLLLVLLLQQQLLLHILVQWHAAQTPLITTGTLLTLEHLVSNT
jgi:hypothetical protein